MFEEFAKQANLNVSSGFCPGLFVLLFLDLRENWSKLVETLQTSVNEEGTDNNENALRTG